MGGTHHSDGPALPLCDHRLGNGAQAVEGPPHRDVDRPSKAIHVGLDHQFAIAVGRIADEPIDRALLQGELGHHLLDGRLIGDIALQEHGLTPVGAHFVSNRGRFVGMRTEVDADVRASLGHGQGAAAPDATGCPRHQNVAPASFMDCPVRGCCDQKCLGVCILNVTPG